MKKGDERKKILIMLSSMNIGGVEKSLLSFLQSLSKKDYNITVLLLEKKGELLNYIPKWVNVKEAKWYPDLAPIIMQSPQATVHGFLKDKKIHKIPSFILAYLLAKKLDQRYIYYKEVMRRIPKCLERYDIAIAYQGPTEIIDYYIAKKVKAVEKISWVHFDVSKHKVNHNLYSELYKKFNRIFVVSEMAKKRLVKKFPEIQYKCERVSNLIVPNIIIEMSKEKVDFDEEYKGIKIVTVGRLSKEKGQDIAIKVLSELRERNYDVKWFCIGEGKDRAFYEDLIKKYNLEDNFILLGAKTNPYPYVYRGDVYVQPSRHEGFCMTLAEAKCLRKPIITTNFAGAQEQIENGENGIIVNDEKELYSNLVKVIEKREYREYLCNNLAISDTNSTWVSSKVVF